MPPGIEKKLKKEKEIGNPEPTGRRRTRSALLDPPAVAQTVHLRATTRSRARQDGATEISAGLPASAERGPSWKRYSDSPTTRPEQEDLSTLLEVDESDFSTQEISNRTVRSQSRAPVHDKDITTGPALKRSPKHKSVDGTNSVQASASSGPAASQDSASGPVNILTTSSAFTTTIKVTNSTSGPTPVPAVNTAQTGPHAGFLEGVLNTVLDRVSKLDGWTVRQYTKLAAHRHWRFFELSLLGLFILLFLGPFYTHYQYSHADESLDNFTHHLLNASLQTRNMSRRLVFIEEQVAKLDAIMVTKEELRAQQAERMQINWLSQFVGAKVILGLTSPAIGANITIKPSWWSQLWYGYKSPTGPGPDAALLPQKGDEPNPTYCVQKKGGRVKLQLAVSLKRHITPTQLIIEHWPKSEVGSFHHLISAATAPKEVELWLYNERARTKEEDIKALQWELEDRFPNHRTNEASVEKKLQLAMQSPADEETDYADSWLMVGRWKYDVYSDHHVQKFLIPFDPDREEAYYYNKISTKAVVIRVISNWGSPYATCLLRARLHGIDRSKKRKEVEVGEGKKSKKIEKEEVDNADDDDDDDEEEEEEEGEDEYIFGDEVVG